MSADFRALCAELIASWDADGCDWKPQHQARWEATVNRARAALAEPEPEGPSDEELEQWYKDCADETTLGAADHYWAFEVPVDYANDLARAVLARWGHQPAPPADGEVAELVAWLREQLHVCLQAPWTPGIKHFGRAAELLQRQVVVPVAVSERLPGPEDCDAEGRCWWGRDESDDWYADWTFATYKAVAEFCEFSPQTVWIPAHALPLPEVGE